MLPVTHHTYQPQFVKKGEGILKFVFVQTKPRASYNSTRKKNRKPCNRIENLAGKYSPVQCIEQK